MSDVGVTPPNGAGDWVRKHFPFVAIAAVFVTYLAFELLTRAGALNLSNGFWLYVLLIGAALLYGAELVTRADDQEADSLHWAFETGLLTAAAVLVTITAQNPAASQGFVWAVGLTVFVVVSGVCALTMRERQAMTWLTAFAITIVVVATAIAGAIAVPLLKAYPDVWTYVTAFLVANAITLLLLFLNENTFARRKAIVQKLLNDLSRATPKKSQYLLPPLKIAALKYGAKLNAANEAPKNDDPQQSTPTSPASRRWPLALSASAYMLFCVIGYLLLLTPIKIVLSDTPPGWVPISLFWTESLTAKSEILVKTVSVAGAAFLGAHIFTLRYLFRAALNNELNQFKWIRATLHMLTGIVVAVLFYRGFQDIAISAGMLPSFTANNALAAWLVVAFVVGMIPDFALSTMYRHFKVRNMKSVKEDETFDMVSVVPVEVIDGIDYDTRYRLEENNIVDVQGLATYNPVLLYAETPYGLIQSFDWVLQARLCIAVGVRSFLELKKVGVRTILQLEDHVNKCPDGSVRMIGQAMYAGAAADRLGAITPTPAAGSPALLDADAVKKAVGVIGQDPAILALRETWTYVNALSDA